MTQPPRIVMVEDQHLFRQMLAQFLQSQCGYAIAGEAADGQQGLQVCLELSPDLALIDLQLQILDGLALARRLHQEAPQIKLMALSARLDAFTVYCLDHSPFSGYIHKNEDFSNLKQAVARCLSGKPSFSMQYLHLRERFNRDPQAFFKILSNREMEILHLIAEGHGSTEIAQQTGLSQRTVETHRYRIMNKLDISSGLDLMNYARRQGFDTLIAPDADTLPPPPP